MNAANTIDLLDSSSSSSSSSSENEEDEEDDEEEKENDAKTNSSRNSNEVEKIAGEEQEIANERSRNEIIEYHRSYMAEVSERSPNIQDSQQHQHQQHHTTVTTSSTNNQNDHDGIIVLSDDNSSIRSDLATNFLTASSTACESNDNIHSLPLGFLKDHCWGCHSWINHPGINNSSNSNSNEICCYALHLHPIIDVPVCVVCAEYIEAVERRLRRQLPRVDASTNENENTSSDDENKDQPLCTMQTPNLAVAYCSACGKSEDDNDDGIKYFLCDYCPRIVCQQCLEQAHGNTSKHSKGITNKLENDTNKWRCFCCSQDENNNNNQNNSDIDPSLLRKLRVATKKLFSTMTVDENNRKQTLEEFLHQLDIIETKKKQCDEKLDNDSDLRGEIRQAIISEGDYDENSSGENGSVIEELVQHGFDEWTKHQTRIFDRISILEDIIKSEYGIEAISAYRYLDNNSNGIHMKYDNDDEPDWKVSADRALAKKEEKERLEMRRKSRQQQPSGRTNKDDNHPRYRVEFTEDVEDLGSSGSSSDENDSDDEKEAYGEGWRHSFFRARQEDIDLAIEAEDNCRTAEKDFKLVARSRAADSNEIKEWSFGLKEMANKSRRASSSSSSLKSESYQFKTLSKSTRSASTGTIKAIHTSTITSQKPPLAFEQRHRGGSTNNRNENTTKQILIKSSPATPSSNLHRKDPKSNEFQGLSPIVLSENPYIAVASHFARHLKEHQQEGIKFMYNNSFADLGNNNNNSNTNTNTNSINIGGCILAHSMGLGKSLACISLLHAIMLQPSLVDPKTDRGKVHKVLLVVPVNTISNWESEFEKWMKGLERKLTITNISSVEMYSRKRLIRGWSNVGGVLLVSTALFRNIMKHDEMEKHLVSADAVVLDESHTMLKNKENQVFKALMKIKTNRRICLSGTPFVNNLLEYYRMVSYIRANILGQSERKFQSEYIEPIEAGLASDVLQSVKVIADERLTELFETLKPFVHRRDASLLLADLPSLQQVVLHVKPTKLQRLLYAEYRKHQKATNQNNFLKQFSSLRNVHNHPGTLLFRNDKPHALKSKPNKEQKPSGVDKKRTSPIDSNSDKNARQPPVAKLSIKEENITDEDSIIDLMSCTEDEDEDEDSESELPNQWWMKVEKKFGVEGMKSIENGNKCLVLFHILAHASTLGEKTVVFSQSLKTLDFLSEILTTENWQRLCPSIAESFPGIPFGGWTQNVDFLRIDGQTNSNERGELLKSFSHNEKLKLFLISSVAGGIGTNLVSANRVVLMDSHFNPTIDLQAIYRCYRYGQKRRVFAYRLLTQGSMEEKVYSRAVNKTGLGNRVIDGKELRRCFKQDEINSLATVDDWVECVRCLKWRMLPPKHTCDVANMPSDWYCEMMNEHDKRRNLTCDFPEKDALWYNQQFKKPNVKVEIFTPPVILDDTASHKISEAETNKLIEQDDVLKNILNISSNNALVVTKKYFHDALLTEKDSFRDHQKMKASVEKNSSDDLETPGDQKAKRTLDFQRKGTSKKERKKEKGAKCLDNNFDEANITKNGTMVAQIQKKEKKNKKRTAILSSVSNDASEIMKNGNLVAATSSTKSEQNKNKRVRTEGEKREQNAAREKRLEHFNESDDDDYLVF